MHKTLDILKYKCWYYQKAIKDGGEEKLEALSPEDLPIEIQVAYKDLLSKEG